MQPEVQRFCWFDTAIHEDTIWKHKRAIEGHKFVLVDVSISIEVVGDAAEKHFQLYDGWTESVWGSFPGIFDQSTLAMGTVLNTEVYMYRTLNHWECKEFTMSIRNTAPQNVRFCAIVYFYELPMSKLETLEYAVKQPRYKYRHGGPRTLSRFED